MPQHILSRRDWLGYSAISGTLLLHSQRLAAADDLPPLQFVIVSDTHLGRNNNQSAEKQWRKAIGEINDLPGEFVLHLGDLVDSGREAQYPVYLETKKLLDKPIHEIPGNHDPADLFSKHVCEEIDRAIDYGGVRFLLLNNARRDSHDGFLSDEQIRWLDKQCGEAIQDKRKIVICCHVPIHTNRSPDRGWYVKPTNGQTAFYEMSQRHAPHVLACLHGHFHNGIRGWRNNGETVEVLCPSVCYNQNRGLTQKIAAGQASGFFVEELRPGYVLAELGNGRFTMRYKPLGNDLNGKYSAQWT